MVLSISAMPGPFSRCFVMTKSVRQHKIVKGGKLQKSESSLTCVVTAEVSANAVPISISIRAQFLHSSLFAWQKCSSSMYDQRHSVDFHRLTLFRCRHIWRRVICLYLCDVERDCPQADADEPAGDWATSYDSVHDVLVNKKPIAILVFILFFT